jgi:hypothetical protein
MLRAIAAEDKGDSARKSHRLGCACLTFPGFPGGKAGSERGAIAPTQHQPMRCQIPIARLTARQSGGVLVIGA